MEKLTDVLEHILDSYKTLKSINEPKNYYNLDDFYKDMDHIFNDFEYDYQHQNIDRPLNQTEKTQLLKAVCATVKIKDATTNEIFEQAKKHYQLK